MTILVDDRIGSKHYAELLGNVAQLARLDSADAAWEAHGLMVGAEIKKTGDALSCMFTSRLADHQLPAMAQEYDIRYLVIEGLYRADPDSGTLQFYKGELGKWGKWHDASVGRKRQMYSAFEMWLHTMSECGGVRLERTADAAATVSLLLSLYHWWQREDHHSFNAMQEIRGDAAVLSRPTMLRRMIALLPRIGWSRSAELARRFPSVRAMVEAPPEAWLIPREIAMETAVKIVAALNSDGSGDK